jgi:hypothetical protein
MPDDFTLAMPVVAVHALETSPLLVVPTSPLPMRRRVEKIGRYFRREFRTDFPPMLANEVPGEYGCIPYEAHLFFEEARDHLEEYRPSPYRIVGAACFRWQTWTNAEASWEFSWVWLHPFSRRRGHLSRAWPQFREKYHNFAMSHVLSRDMEAFLAKRRTEA